MNKVFPFLLLAGLTCIVLVGLWTVDRYDAYSVYPEEVYTYLMVGIGLIIIAFFMAQFKGKQVTEIEKDNRVLINKVWENKIKVGDKAVLIILIGLAVIAIFNFKVALSLIVPIICLGIIVTGFLYIMHDDGEGDEWDPPKNRFMQIFLRLIDYRNHPFSISLVLFILVVVTLLLSKHFGFTLNIANDRGYRRYVATIPSLMKILPGLMFSCGFLYIIQRVDFLGIRQAKQSTPKLIAIHFGELIVCGVTLFILLISAF